MRVRLNIIAPHCSPAPKCFRTKHKVGLLTVEEGPLFIWARSFLPIRAVEKDLEGKKGNVLMASGPTGKIATRVVLLLVLHFQRLIVGVCSFCFLS